MIWDILSAKQERRTLWQKMVEISEKLGAEKRDFTAEEKTAYDKMEADMKKMTDNIDRHERLLAMKDEQAAQRDKAADMKPAGEKTPADSAKKDEAYDKAIRALITRGVKSLTLEQRELVESRAQATTPDSAGGFLIPTTMYDRLVKAQQAYGGVRNSRARIMRTTSGNPMTIPGVDNTSRTARILGENTPMTTFAQVFTQRRLGAFTYATDILPASIQFLQDTAFDIEAEIIDLLGEMLGKGSNAHFTTGTGSNQPQGVVTAASSGVVAATGNATTITYANLVNLEHSVDPAYRTRAEWMFHDSTLRALKLLVDGQQRPLWSGGMSVREPDTILGYRYVINQDMPQMAANARSILFGDFSKFVIRDVLDAQIARLDERFADALQVGFLGFSRHDCNLTDTAAVRFYQNSAT